MRRKRGKIVGGGGYHGGVRLGPERGGGRGGQGGRGGLKKNIVRIHLNRQKMRLGKFKYLIDVGRVSPAGAPEETGTVLL